MHLREIQKLVFNEYTINGYLKMWSNNFSKNYTQIENIYDIAELGLINTEISESLEIIRQSKFLDDTNSENMGLELADIIIRVLNFASRKNMDIEYYILEKNRFNLNREKLHGNVV